MIAKNQITGVVLAGGKSSRFGSDKALFVYNGTTLLEHSIQLLTPFCEQVYISGQCQSYRCFNMPCIPDIITDIGPLGGIYSAMLTINTPYYLFVSCDMPFMTSQCIQRLLTIDNHVQMTYWLEDNHNMQLFPLLISRSMLGLIKEQINFRSYRIRTLLDKSIHTSFDILPKDQTCFTNINYLSDII